MKICMHIDIHISIYIYILCSSSVLNYMFIIHAYA